MALFQEIPASFGSKFTARVDASQWVSATLLLATACQGSVQGADYDIQVLPEDGGFTMAFTAYNEDMVEVFCRLNALPLPSQSEALRRGPGVFEQLTQEAPMQPVLAQDKQHLRRLIAAAIEQHGLQCDLNHIDVSNIEDFSELFKSSLFNGDISRWNVSSAKDMSNLFAFSVFNGDISEWNTEQVTDMRAMFYKGQFNGDVSRWNTANVKTMESMFQGPGNNPRGVDQWNVSQVDTFFRMFRHNPHVFDLANWVPHPCAYTDSFMDVIPLTRSKSPCFFHWKRALDAQGTEYTHLRPEWRAHFERWKPLATGMGLNSMQGAHLMQEQWLSRPPDPTCVETWSMPFGESP